MKLRKYYADNPQEAFKQIRAELGPDAIILDTRKVWRGGWLGFLKGPLYEVTAGIDTLVGEAGTTLSRDHLLSESERPSGNAQWRSDLVDIRASIKQMQETVARLSNARSSRGIRRAGRLSELRDLLLAQGLDAEIVHQVVQQADYELSRRALQDWSIVRDCAIRYLEQRMPTIEVIDCAHDDPLTLLVIGATGVGKTTTVAKLGSIFAANNTKKVTLATIDTVRVGAVPQLQAYADILGLPMEIVYTASELERVIDQCSKGDIIVIDTPGLSPRGPGKEKLKEFARALRKSVVLLAVSSTTLPVDAARAMASLEGIRPDALILTKLDEVDRYGSVFNIVSACGVPIAYVTTGQNVPEDIERASARSLAARLLG